MTLLEQYIDCMKKGNNVALSELFEEKRSTARFFRK